MDSEEEDYVFFGTPIEREEEITNRWKKAAAEASGNLRSLPPWKQEVRDEEGRRRFHGAFTGGFSAGYYNTVGTKEGWTPQLFTSSRKNRAEVKQQSIFNFLDEDEKSELEGQYLGTSSQFDTFGSTAAEYARKQADKEQKQRQCSKDFLASYLALCVFCRPSAIPGPVPDELVLPASESIGVKLLLKMGWRRGHAIKDSHTSSLCDARKEAGKAFLAFASEDTKAPHPSDYEPVEGEPESFIERPAADDAQSSQSIPIFVLNPKQDLHGLGYDPFKHAPEFREKKILCLSNNKQHGNRKAISIEDSLFGSKFHPQEKLLLDLELVHLKNLTLKMRISMLPSLDLHALIVNVSSVCDITFFFVGDWYSCYLGLDFEETFIEEDEEPSRLSIESKQKVVAKDQGVLAGFKVASVSDYQLERFDPPIIPKDFVPHHKFPGPLETLKKLNIPSPPEKEESVNPLFSFLSGGNGHDYYARKLWEEHQKRGDQAKLSLDRKLSPSVQKMTAESRGKLLGEKPLERSLTETTSSSVASGDFVQLQINLSDTFKKHESFSELPEVAKPFKDDPAKQERFEQFLKEKHEG
ncbi:hypothetical protein CRYUN_Cryun07bG0029400 [Craigia yunnanensis]